MDMTSSYAGLTLNHPFMVGASPLSDTVESVKAAVAGGASAVVMRSLFEEQVTAETMATHDARDFYADTFAEAASVLPEHDAFVLGPEQYLDHVALIKQAIDVPVIASLNGSTARGWVEFAQAIERTGADAIEINPYQVITDLDRSSADVERNIVDMVRAIHDAVGIPLAIKISPMYTALPNMAKRLVEAGAAGIVLFNRYFEPDIELEELAVSRQLKLSTASELPLRLRWLAILSERVKASLAVSGGVHSAADAVKAIMCGAEAVQLVSAVLNHGEATITEIRESVEGWLSENEYQSLAQLRGSMNLLRCPNPNDYLRANYIYMLQTWQPG